jgi:FimV-like protein
VYQRAVGLLKESASKLPDTPVVECRLGLASLEVGDKESARRVLAAVVRSSTTVARKEARKALVELR